MGNEGGKKILLVDDEVSIVDLLADILIKNGFTVFKANDGKKGLDDAKKLRPDLVVLDVNMPKMDGFKVLENLKKDKKTRDIPVIMLTTRASADDISQGMQLYADKYLPKPFEGNQLVAEINKTFATRQL